MTVNVIFKNDIIGTDFRTVTSLIGLVALDGIFIMDIKVPNCEDYETMADTIEREFAIKYPGKDYTSYTVRMPKAC